MPCNCHKPKSCNMPPACLALAQKCDPVLFHKVMFPAAAGNDVTNPPSTLAYKNVLLEYEANGHLYLYSSDGVPTQLPSELNTDELMNIVNELKAQLQAETEARTQADNTLTESVEELQQSVEGNVTAIDAEETARKQADVALNEAIANEVEARKQADTQINDSIVKTAQMLQDNINAEVNARESDRDNLQTNINAEVNARIAADQELEKKIEGMSAEALETEIEERKAADAALKTKITQEQQAREEADAEIKESIEAITIAPFTNDTAGSIKGSEQPGYLAAQPDGTGSVNGWDGLSHDVENLSELVHSQTIPKLYTTEVESDDGSYTASYLNPTISKVSKLTDIQQIGSGLDLTNNTLSAVPEGVLSTDEFNNEWENANGE